MLQAPAAIEIHDQNHLQLASGNSILEVPQSIRDFMLTTDDAQFVEPVNARIQITADPGKGTIARLTRGAIQQRSLASNMRPGLQLSEHGMFQSVVRSVASTPEVSRVTIAQGKDKFVGQIGDGDNQLQTESPVVMANVLSEISEASGDREAASVLLDNWSEIVTEVKRRQLTAPNQLMDLIKKYRRSKTFANPEQIPGYNNPNHSSSFQGSISINGVTQSFDSPDAFEDAMRQIHDRFELPDLNQRQNRPFDLLPGFSGSSRR